MKLTDASSGRQLEIEIIRPLGSGLQGQTNVVRVCGERAIQVHKRYRAARASSPLGRHLVGLVGHVSSHMTASERSELPGLPSQAVADDSGGIGLLMPFLDGQPLSTPGLYRSVFGDLEGRLDLATCLARQVELLDRARIVWADPSEANVLRLGLRLMGIDFDGAGVLAPGGDFHPGLGPTVRYTPDGALFPPELATDPRLAPSVESDRWALAVLLHRLLFAGEEPFFWVVRSDDIETAAVTWPPEPGLVEAGALHFHTAVRESLGPALDELFREVFRPVSRGWVPALRPSAERWREALQVAAGWTWRCQCGQQLVAEQRSACPYCSARLPHAQVLTRRGAITLRREGQLINGSDIGLKTRPGPVFRIRRRKGQLLLDAFVPLEAAGRRLGPGGWETGPLPPGRSEISIGSSDGWGHPLRLVLMEPAR